MSNMKDYMMWLDDRGIAKWDTSIGELIIPNGTNVYSPELIDKYKNDAQWHSHDLSENEAIQDQWNRMGGAYDNPAIVLDDDDFIIDDEEELIIDDGDMDDCAWSPDDYWFRPEGGLTGDAYNFLYTLDSKGEFV